MCSSDLPELGGEAAVVLHQGRLVVENDAVEPQGGAGSGAIDWRVELLEHEIFVGVGVDLTLVVRQQLGQIGRASCRERV